MLAAEEGHVDIAQLLLEAGADKDWPDLTGKTPLMFAARFCSSCTAIAGGRCSDKFE